MQNKSKKELFEKLPVPKALMKMAVPTVISQLINLVYNMVDAFFIGRTGNSYMVAATSLTLTLVMMNTALSNLFGVGGGSLVARLMGASNETECRKVSAFSIYGSLGTALAYSLLTGAFLSPLLVFLGASDATLEYARQYTLIVIVIGSAFSMLSMTLAHMLRNTGHSVKASAGLSAGGILNMALDPLFMFVLLPGGSEVIGAALATLISNVVSFVYLAVTYARAIKSAPLSFKLSDAAGIAKTSVKNLFSVGVPSAILTGLFDLANICANMIAAAHSDLVLAGLGIVMKVERVPNAVNIGICQGAMPIIAYNYSAGNSERTKKTINTARLWGLAVSLVSILLFELLSEPVIKVFMDTAAEDTALLTVGFATMFLRLRCLASPAQFINYHASFCMQAMGNGRSTMIHAFVREIIFYIPFMFVFDRFFGETGLACALPVGELCGAIFATWLLLRTMRRGQGKPRRSE